MNRNLVEALMGAVVLGIAALFIVFAYSKSKWAPVEGYPLIAQFDRIDGLHEGSDVRLGGVKVGSVVTLNVDLETYMARVVLQIKHAIKLPKDTVAEVVSDGLLGAKYLALVPGGEDDMLRPGDKIQHTQSSVSLESMIGKLIFSKDDKDKERKSKEAAASQESPGEMDKHPLLPIPSSVDEVSKH